MRTGATIAVALEMANLAVVTRVSYPPKHFPRWVAIAVIAVIVAVATIVVFAVGIGCSLLFLSLPQPRGRRVG